MATNRPARQARPGANRRPPAPDDAEAWFAPKRHGIGAGLPHRWQGWALLAAFLLAVTGLAMPAIGLPTAGRLIASLALTALFLLIVARKTRGGWRWRNGED